jgi:hypothetical protein
MNTETNVVDRVPEEAAFIYLFESTDGLFKVGRSENPNSRILDVRSPRGGKLSIRETYSTNVSVALEAEVHHFFRSHRVEGEWFSLDQDSVQNFGAIVQQCEKDLLKRRAWLQSYPGNSDPFGKILERLRIAARLSISQLAVAAGLPHQTHGRRDAATQSRRLDGRRAAARS